LKARENFEIIFLKVSACSILVPGNTYQFIFYKNYLKTSHFAFINSLHKHYFVALKKQKFIGAYKVMESDERVKKEF
jgi:hypothetical protein